MIEVDEDKPRSFYPWFLLEEVGDFFHIKNKYAHQLVYMKNKSNKNKGLPDRYKAKKDGENYQVIRIS